MANQIHPEYLYTTGAYDDIEGSSALTVHEIAPYGTDESGAPLFHSGAELEADPSLADPNWNRLYKPRLLKRADFEVEIQDKILVKGQHGFVNEDGFAKILQENQERLNDVSKKQAAVAAEVKELKGKGRKQAAGAILRDVSGIPFAVPEGDLKQDYSKIRARRVSGGGKLMDASEIGSIAIREVKRRDVGKESKATRKGA